MTKPIEEMSLEEIAAERAAIAAERAALKDQRQLQPETVVELPVLADPAPIEDQTTVADVEGEPEEAPWPHEHLVYLGLELDVRMPSQNALMGIAMLNQLEGNAQLYLFNQFLAMHLSPESFAKVASEFMRPDSEMTMQGLVQQLVYLRTGGSDED